MDRFSSRTRGFDSPSWHTFFLFSRFFSFVFLTFCNGHSTGNVFRIISSIKENDFSFESGTINDFWGTISFLYRNWSHNLLLRKYSKKYSSLSGCWRKLRKEEEKVAGLEVEPAQPAAKLGDRRGRFSGTCPNLVSVVVLWGNSMPICHPLLAMGMPLASVIHHLFLLNLPEKHVPVLGLGRRTLLLVVRHRHAYRALYRFRELWGSAGGSSFHGENYLLFFFSRDIILDKLFSPLRINFIQTVFWISSSERVSDFFSFFFWSRTSTFRKLRWKKMYVVYCPAVFGHFFDPPGNHPRGTIFPDMCKINQSSVDLYCKPFGRLIDWLMIS